jgi:hypothetical protein
MRICGNKFPLFQEPLDLGMGKVKFLPTSRRTLGVIEHAGEHETPVVYSEPELISRVFSVCHGEQERRMG